MYIDNLWFMFTSMGKICPYQHFFPCNMIEFILKYSLESKIYIIILYIDHEKSLVKFLNLLLKKMSFWITKISKWNGTSIKEFYFICGPKRWKREKFCIGKRPTSMNRTNQHYFKKKKKNELIKKKCPLRKIDFFKLRIFFFLEKNKYWSAI